MTDLHAWITAKVDEAERRARDGMIGGLVAVVPDGGTPIVGTVVGVGQTDGGMQLTVQQYGTPASASADLEPAAAVLRRCEADRRILARHNIDPVYADSSRLGAACGGCGFEGDCDDPVTENLNDCPELLDLAHAHGITPEILASLDRPEPPPRKPDTGPTLTHWLLVPTRATDIPPALRGPNWKADR